MRVTRQNKADKTGVVTRTARYGKWGLSLGGVLCALPILSYLLFGSKAFDELNTSLPKVLGLYIVGGCVAGALVGLVMPIIESDFIAAVVGSVVGILAACAIQILDTNTQPWTFDSIAIAIVWGVGLGGPLGVSFRRRLHRGNHLNFN